MFNRSKSRFGALAALTLSANLLLHPTAAQAEEVDSDLTAAPATADTAPETATEAISAPETAPEPAVSEAADSQTAAVSDVSAATASTEAAAEASQEVAAAAVSTETAALQTSAEASPAAAETTEAPLEAIVNAAEDTTSQAQDFIMPAYAYANPSAPYWSRMTALGGDQIPFIIFNPNSGSGTAPIDSFAQQLAANSAAGIRSLGYINTKEFSRPQADIFAEINRYTTFYGANNIAGFFFDEALNGRNPAQVPYMADLYNYVKTTYPHMIVMANPGATITDDIAPYADIWLTSETSADSYINNFRERLSSFETDPSNASRIMHLAHSASPDQYDQIIALSRQRNAGYLMITDDGGANPYDTLPTDFESLVARINSGETPTVTPTAPAVPTALNTAGETDSNNGTAAATTDPNSGTAARAADPNSQNAANNTAADPNSQNTANNSAADLSDPASNAAAGLVDPSSAAAAGTAGLTTLAADGTAEEPANTGNAATSGLSADRADSADPRTAAARRAASPNAQAEEPANNTAQELPQTNTLSAARLTLLGAAALLGAGWYFYRTYKRARR